MSKQLEELRHESSFLKNKLIKISKKQKNFSRNNKNVGNTISFNKANLIVILMNKVYLKIIYFNYLKKLFI